MMGNFFRLTCPYLFSLDTVAYFPLIKGEHSFAAIAKVHDTTQLLIDVSPDVPGPGEAAPRHGARHEGRGPHRARLPRAREP
jgi:hypothetical protein